MTKDEALKLALEALENSVDLVSQEARNAEELYGKYPTRLARIQGLVAFEVAHEKAITALREALNASLAEQPEQEPVALVIDGVLVKSELPEKYTGHLYTTPPQRERLAQPEQEPVAWLYRDAWGTMKLSQVTPPPVGAFPVYTAPPPCLTCEALARTVMLDQTSHDSQRKPLTDEDLRKLADKHLFYQPEGYEVSGVFAFARAIEAKLKEKNT